MAKNYLDYVLPNENSALKEYLKQPATAFLRYIVASKNAANQCLRNFPKKQNGEYDKASIASIRQINAGLLASIMGNFETFQRYLFANIFEYSIYLNKFDLPAFIKRIEKTTSLSSQVKLERIFAYRDKYVNVGIILADGLPNWHSPSKVNEYFAAFALAQNGKSTQFYSNENIRDLEILWQLRHSIVHTAGTISIPDSQKLAALSEYGDKMIMLDSKFILELSRRFHPLVYSAVKRLENVYMCNLKTDLLSTIQQQISNTFEVKSSCQTWLK